jgi:hypothetical protein
MVGEVVESRDALPAASDARRAGKGCPGTRHLVRAFRGDGFTAARATRQNLASPRGVAQ